MEKNERAELKSGDFMSLERLSQRNPDFPPKSIYWLRYSRRDDDQLMACFRVLGRKLLVSEQAFLAYVNSQRGSNER